MRRQLHHVGVAHALPVVAEAHRQGLTQIDHQRQRVMSLFLRMQAAEDQPRRRGLLQRVGDRIVLEHQNAVEQRITATARPTLNVVKRRVFMFAQGQILGLDLLDPVGNTLLGTRAGDHRQCVDEQTELFLDTRQLGRTPRHRCTEGHAGLPGVALQHQQPGRLHQRIEGYTMFAGELAQCLCGVRVDQLQVIALPGLARLRLEALHQAGRLIQLRQLSGPETFAERCVLTLQPFDVIAITAGLSCQRLSAVTLQHFAQQARTAPAVHENVVAGVDQLMFVFCGAQYRQTQQRRLSQIKALSTVRIGPVIQPLRRLASGIHLGERHRYFAQHHLQ